jgi:hypothetical protein
MHARRDQNQPHKDSNMNALSEFKGGLLAGCAAALAALMLWASPASAVVCTGSASDPETCTARTGGNGSACMGDLFGGALVCTANDVRIGFADNVRDPTTNTAITSCISGSTLAFKADFHVELTAQARYDIGLYFATDGDAAHDGARAGQCSVSKITAASNTSNFINLDNPGAQPTDSCGDIDDAHNPQVVTLTLSAACAEGALFFNPTTGKCQATSPGPGAAKCMALPNCTSWRQTGANGVCDSPLDAFPGTKSKCNCDDAFGIPVIVEQATLAVVKTAYPTSVTETGHDVTYTVQVTNNAQFVSVTISSIIDDLYGDLSSDATNTLIKNSTCDSMVGSVLAPGGSKSCQFDAFVSGNTGDEVTDTVEVCGDDTGNHHICGDDFAVVDITDVAAAPTILKSASNLSSLTVDVEFTVTVTNNSDLDTLTVNSLNDDKFGDITTTHGAGGGFEQVVSTDCNTLIGAANKIAVSSNKSCKFVGRILATGLHENVVTGSATDSDGVTTNGSSTPPLKDSAKVQVTVTLNP